MNAPIMAAVAEIQIAALAWDAVAADAGDVARCAGRAFGMTRSAMASPRRTDAAFTHTRPGGNRFNDENRGAWYCGFDADTAVGEVSYHLTRELEAIGRFENVTDYAELIADFFGQFHDLRDFNVEVDRSCIRIPQLPIRLVRASPDSYISIIRATESSIPQFAPPEVSVSSAFGPTLCRICGKAVSRMAGRPKAYRDAARSIRPTSTSAPCAPRDPSGATVKTKIRMRRGSRRSSTGRSRMRSSDTASLV